MAPVALNKIIMIHRECFQGLVARSGGVLELRVPRSKAHCTGLFRDRYDPCYGIEDRTIWPGDI